MLDIQLFLQPQLVSHREHRLQNYKGQSWWWEITSTRQSSCKMHVTYPIQPKWESLTNYSKNSKYEISEKYFRWEALSELFCELA